MIDVLYRLNTSQGGTPKNDLYVEASPERKAISALGIWKGKYSLLLIEVYERVGKCVISVCEKSRKSSGFGLFAYFKASAFTAVKRDAKV